MQLDDLDRRILAMLQTDNQMSNIGLAEHVGLSPPACSRRVARLRSNGIIVRDVSIVDPQLVGHQLMALVTITLDVRRQELLELFEKKMRARREVVQCYMVSGGVDYVAVAVLRNMDAYSVFASEVFAKDENIRSYESWFVLSRVKFETKVELV